MKCEVCGRPTRNWGKPGTLQGCHRYIALNNEGKLRTVYFGAVHKKCNATDWLRQLEEGVRQGWLIKVGDGRYQVAPQYQ